MITPHRSNKHRVVLKNPNGNTEVKEDKVVAADDRSNPTPNQSSVENPSTDPDTNNDKQNQNQNQHQKDSEKIQVVQLNIMNATDN